MKPAAARRRPRATPVLLALLLGWSFLLRLWFASFDLTAGRFFDERYSLENVRALLEGHLRPANAWYPSLAHLPQAALLAASDALHRATGAEVFAVFAGGGFSPTAYLLCRLTVVVFGVLTLWATWRLGRRLFSPAAGLGGALLLSVVPAHIRLSASFKPDMLLLLLALLAFGLALRAAERPTAGRFLAAGAAVGLTASAKLNGALAALPLAAVALVLVRHDRRHLLRLAAAGLAAAAVFLALNPFVGLTLDHLERNRQIYQERAALEGTGRLEAPLQLGLLLLSPGFHGPWVGTAAGLGLALLAASALRWRSRMKHRPVGGRSPGGGRRPALGRIDLPRLLLPVFVVGYLVLAGAAAEYPKANHALLVVPWTSLAAVWLLLTVWGRLGERWPVLERRGATAAAVLVALALLLPPAHRWAYAAAVPTTAQRAQEVLKRELRPFAGRTLLYEGDEPPRLLGRREAVALRRHPGPAVPGNPETAPDALALSDAELFPVARLADPEAESWRRDSEGRNSEGQLPVGLGTARVLTFEPRLGRVRGPALVLRLHPWEAAGRAVLELPRDAAGRWPVALPEGVEPGEWVSLQLLVRGPQPPPGEVGLRIGGQPLGLVRTKIETGGYVWGHAWTSPRFQAAGGEEAFVFELPEGLAPPRPSRLDVLRWKPPPGWGEDPP